MPANNRIYYASQAVLLEPQNSDGSSLGSQYAPQGLQSVGMTTNFGLQQIFQLGQLDLYDNVENVPEVEVTLNKTLDGTAPLYLLCMGGSTGVTGASGKELAEIATNRVNFRLGVYPDTVTAATGNATHFVYCSGMYLSRIAYTFPVDAAATEEITLVGNNKVWGSGGTFTMGEFDPGPGGTSPKAPSIIRRFSLNTDLTVLPTGSGGGIPIPSGRTENRPYVNNIKISSDLGREAIFELGKMAPYFRYVKFPVEVTSEFEVTASDGDKVNADDFSTQTGCGNSFSNLLDQQVKVVVCGSGAGDLLAIDLGNKNKLTSVNYSGGDTGGGNATITYSYQTFNKLVVTGSGSFVDDTWFDNTADTDNYV